MPRPLPGGLVTGVALLFLATTAAALDQDEPSVQGKTLTEWTKLLKDPSAATRRQAAQALQQLGPKAGPASGELVKALKDSDNSVRFAAQMALRAIGEDAAPALAAGLKEKDGDTTFRTTVLSLLNILGPKAKAAAPALVEVVKGQETSLRYNAAYSLARIGPEGVKLLMGLLQEKDDGVRLAAIYGIAGSGGNAKELLDVAKVAIKDSSQSVRSQALGIASRHGAAGLPILIEGIKDKDLTVRYYAIQYAGNLGPAAKEAVPALRGALKDANQYSRLNAINALGRIGKEAKAALPELTELCEDKDPGVRQAALGMIFNLGKESVSTVGTKALKNPDPMVRLTVASNLARAGVDAMDPLQKFLKDESAPVRAAAADGIGTLGLAAKDAAPALKQALEDKEGIVRVAAAAALWRVEEKPGASIHLLLNALEDTSSVVRARAGSALVAVGKPSVSVLVEMLRGKEESERRRAALGLATLGVLTGDAVPDLMKALADDSLAVRQNVAQALGRVGFPAVTKLLEGLKSQDDRVRAGSADAFNHLTVGTLPPASRTVWPQVTSALTEALKDKNALVRINVAQSMTRLGMNPQMVLPVLREAMNHEEVGIRRGAVATLALMRNSNRIPFMQLGDVDDILTKVLKDRDLGIRIHAASAFVPAYGFGSRAVTTAPPDAVAEALAEGLRKGDDELRRTSMTALARLGGHAHPAAETLTEALKHKDSFFRQHAAYALERIGPAAKSAVPTLTEALADKELVVRQLAAQALSAVGPDAKAAVEALTQTVEKEEDLLLRLSAVEALGRIGPASKPAVPALRKLLKNPPATTTAPFGRQPFFPGGTAFAVPRPNLGSTVSVVLQALVGIGPGAAEAVPEIAAMLKGNENDSRTAAWVLSSLGAAAAPALLEGLKSKDAGMRALCAEALGGLEDAPDDTVKALMEALDDKDTNVRQQSAFALARLGPAAKSAAPALTALLKNKEHDADSRGLAAQALGEMGAEGKAAVPVLIAALKDEDSFVRQQAAGALGGIGPNAKDAIDALADLEKDENVNVRRAARRALEKIR